MDVLDKLYESFKTDPYISEQVGTRIKYYEYPESGDVDNPYMVLEEIAPAQPGSYADGTWLTLSIFVQVEIWSPNRTITSLLAERVRDHMWRTFQLKQVGGITEHDNGFFRDARRYQGSLYREDLDQL